MSVRNLGIKVDLRLIWFYIVLIGMYTSAIYFVISDPRPINTERQLEIFAACIADVPKESPQFADAIGECLIASRELSR